MKLFPDNFVQNADKAINAIDGFLKKYKDFGTTSTNLDTANADLKKYKANLEEAQAKLESFGNITTTKQAWDEQRRQVESYEQSLDAVIKKSAEVNASKKTPKTTNNEDYNNLTKLIQLQNEYNRVVVEGNELRKTTGVRTNAVKNAVANYLQTENISIQKLQRSYAGLRSAETSYIQQMATTDTNSKEWEKLKTSLDGVRSKMLANKLVMNQLKKEAVSQELTQSFGLTKFTDTSFSKAAQQFISSARAQLQQLRAEGQSLDILNPQDLAEFDKLIQKIDEATTRAHDFEDAFQKKNEASSMVDEKTKEVEKLQKAFDNFDSKGKIDKLFSDLEKLGISTDGIEKSAEGVQQLKEHLLGVNSDGVKKLNDEFGKTKTQVQASENAINKIRNSLGDLGQATTSLQQMNSEFEQLKSQAQYFFGLTNSFNLLKRAIRGAYETVKKLDAAMTETAVVTDFSVGDMWEQLPQYTTMAKKLGATTEGAYRTAALYYQQGLDTAEAMQLSTETMKMARVAGMEYATATKAMTSALRGFNMELNDMSAQRVNDVYSELAKITATDTQQLATAMTKTASIAYSANMEFENVSAFLAQILETTQEAPETAGTALKTIIGRFTEIKKLYSSNQLIGKDSEGEEIQVNKVATALSAAGINLNEFFTGAKGLDDILYELSQRWDTLDVTIQRYIATQAAGSRQQSRFIALMQNNARLTELMNAAKNSKGSAEGQFEKTLDSLEAKVNKLRDAWEEFLMGIANSDLIKGSIDLLTKLLEVINKLTKGTGGLDSALMKLAVVGTALQLGGGLLQGGLGYFNARRYAVQAKGMAKAGVDPNTIKAVSNGFTGDENIGSFMSYLGGGLANFGNLGFVGMAKDMIKGLFTGVKGLFTNVLDAEKTGEIGNAILKANQGFLTDDALSAAARTQAYANAMKTTRASGKFSQLWAGLTTGVNTKSQLKQSVAEYAKITGIELADAATGAQAYEQAITRMNAANGGATTGLAKFGAILGANLPLVLGITAAVGALVAIGLAVYFNSAAYKLKKLNKEIEELDTELENIQESQENLKNFSKTHDQLVEELKDLKIGTAEWNEKLIEANQSALELIEKYPRLKYEVGSNGLIEIDSTSLKALNDSLIEERKLLSQQKLNKINTRNKINAEEQLKNTRKSVQYDNGKVGSQKVITTIRLDTEYQKYQQNPDNTTDFISYLNKQYSGNEHLAEILKEGNNYLSAILDVDKQQAIAKASMVDTYVNNNEIGKTAHLQKQNGDWYSEDEVNSIISSASANIISTSLTDEDKFSKKNIRKTLGEIQGISTDDLEFKDVANFTGKATNDLIEAWQQLGHTVEELPTYIYNEDGTYNKDKFYNLIIETMKEALVESAVNATTEMIQDKGVNSTAYRLLTNDLTNEEATKINSVEDLKEIGLTDEYVQSQGYKNLDTFFNSEEFQNKLNAAKNFTSEVLTKELSDIFTNQDIESIQEQFNGLGVSTSQAYLDILKNGTELAGKVGAEAITDIIEEIPAGDAEKTAKAIQLLSNANLKDKDSIKQLIKTLVDQKIITGEVADKIENELVDAFNAVKNIDIESVIDRLKNVNKIIRDARKGNQQTSFTEDEYQNLMKLLPTDIDWSKNFTQDLDGNYVLVVPINNLITALKENTSALLGEGTDQLEAKQAMGDILHSIISMPEYSSDTSAKRDQLQMIQDKMNSSTDFLEAAKTAGYATLLNVDLTGDIDDTDFQDKINNLWEQYSEIYQLSEVDSDTGKSWYQNRIDQADLQEISFEAQAMNPLRAREQALNYLDSGNNSYAQAYGDAFIAVANGYGEAINQDILNRFKEINQLFKDGKVDATTYADGVREITAELSRVEGNENLEKLRGSLDNIKEGMTEANKAVQYSAIAQNLKDLFGVEVDASWVKDNIDKIKAWTEEGADGIEKMRKELIKIQDIEIDPIEINTILSTGDALDKINGLVNYLGNLTGQNYNLNITGTANMQDIVDSIGTIIMQLGIIKAAASGDSEKAIQIMENAQTVIEQIAEAMGFKMTTNYDMKEIKSNFQNYEFKTTGSPETGDLKGGWVPAGTTTLPVGQEISWSFEPTEGGLGGSGGSATTSVSGHVIRSITQDSSTGEITMSTGNLGGLSKNDLKNKPDTTFNPGNLSGGKTFADIDWNLVSDLFGDFVYDNSKIQPTSPPYTYGDKDPNKGGGGSGSGSKDSPSSNDEDKWKNSYDWLYNLTQDINAELEKREKLELKYNNILKDRNKTAKELYQNAKTQLASLEKSRNLNAEAYMKRRAELQLEAKQATAQYTNDTRFNMKWGTGLASGGGSSSGLRVINLAGSGGGGSGDTKKDQGKRTMLSEAELGRYATFNWDDNTVEINWDAVNQITDQQKGEAVEDYISKLEEIQEKMNEAEKSLLEIDGKIREIIDQGKDEFKDFEQQIFDALVSRYQKEIDKLTEISEAITDANSKLIDSMTNAIDKEREARDNEKTETELADKQKQLDYLQSDTSNANAKQILDLEKELAEGQEDYTDQLIDQKIDELKEQNDKASEQRQVQIDLMTKNLEMAQETGALWQEVYNLMDVGVDQEGALVKQSELFDLLQSEAGWQGMSAVSKMTWLDELTETVKAGMAYLMTGRQLEYIGAEAGKQITFSAYDEQGKLQWLTGTVDKNGDVVDSNGVRYSEIFQNYDGSFTTMETAGVGTKKEPPKPEVKPSAPSYSSGTNTTSSNSSGTVWKIGGYNGVLLNSDGSNSGVSVWDVSMGVSNAEVRALRDVPGDLSGYDDNKDGFLDKKELGAVWKDNPDVNPKDSKYLEKYDEIWDPYYKKYPSTKYKTGGLNTQTGPAWLDGTFAKPELVLNSKDTANFLELRDLLRALQISIKSPHRDLTDNNKNNGDNYYEIDINVESIADDYDVAKMADKIKKLISQDALYRNGNAINRLR